MRGAAGNRSRSASSSSASDASRRYSGTDIEDTASSVADAIENLTRQEHDIEVDIENMRELRSSTPPSVRRPSVAAHSLEEIFANSPVANATVDKSTSAAKAAKSPSVPSPGPSTTTATISSSNSSGSGSSSARGGVEDADMGYDEDDAVSRGSLGSETGSIYGDDDRGSVSSASGEKKKRGSLFKVRCIIRCVPPCHVSQSILILLLMVYL
jgi:hypothetical protein